MLLLLMAGGAGPAAPDGGSDAPAAAELYKQARAAVRAGQYDQAVPLLVSAVREEPDQADYRTLLAQTYVKMGLNDKAAAEYSHLGDVYCTAGRHALAVEAFERAGELGLAGAGLHVRLATAHFQLKQYLGTVTTRRVKNGSPGRIVGEYYLLEPAPDRADTYYACPPSSALYHVQRALDAGFDDPAIHLLHAGIWLEVQRYEKALAIYRSIEKKVPAGQRADYYFHSARAALGADALHEYLARLGRAIELDPQTYGPKLADAYRSVAQRYNQRGDLGGYIRYLEMAAKTLPESADLHYRLGNAYWESNRRSPAARQWQISLELQPDHPDRERMLGLIRDASLMQSRSR